jgi:hypothetical protein
MIAHADSVYAKAGFVPRRKGQRYPALAWDLCDFYDQQGRAHETVANPVISLVEYLGTFQGWDHYGSITTYRAFAVRLKDMSVVAGYSRDDDPYVLCQHQGYLRPRPS